MRFLFVCLCVVFLFICYFFVIVSFLLSVAVVVPVNSWFSVIYSNCHFFLSFSNRKFRIITWVLNIQSFFLVYKYTQHCLRFMAN